jgi:cell division GTPase FtsZ
MDFISDLSERVRKEIDDEVWEKFRKDLNLRIGEEFDEQTKKEVLTNGWATPEDKMEKRAVIDPEITPTLKETNEKLEKNASVDNLDNDMAKKLATKVQETVWPQRPMC